MVESLQGGAEDNTLTMLVWNHDYAPALAEKIRSTGAGPNIFSTRHYQKIAKAAIDYIERFGHPPEGHITDLLERDLRGDEGKFLLQTIRSMERMHGEMHYEYVWDIVDKFLRIRQWMRATDDAYEASRDGDEEKILALQEKAKEALNVVHTDDGLESMTAAQLWAQELSEPACIVEGVLYEGLMIFGGMPYIGKSVFMQRLGLACATGQSFLGKPTRHTGVLYLAAEPRQYGMYKRLHDFYQQQPDVHDFHTVWKVPLLSGGLVEKLHRKVDKLGNIGVVVIDTLARVWPDSKGDQSQSYMADTRVLAPIRDLAEDYGLAIVLVTHTRKTPASNVFDELLGSRAFQAVSTSNMVMTGELNKPERILHMINNYGKGGTLATDFDQDNLSFSDLYEAVETTDASRETVTATILVQVNDGPVRLDHIEHMTGKHRTTVRRAADKLIAGGLIVEPRPGVVALPPRLVQS